MTRENLVFHELNGLSVRVTKSSDPTLRSLRGRVTYETKNTITISSGSKLRIVPKATSEFAFALPGGSEVIVAGKALELRPEDRVKRGISTW